MIHRSPIIPAQKILFPLLSALLLAGCATRTITTGVKRGAAMPAPDDTIAVAPFENLSTSRHAGLALTDLANTVLYSLGEYKLVEVSDLNDNKEARFRRLEISPWERQLGVNTAAAAALGRAMRSNWVLAGSVGEYGFVDGFGETATVGVTLRLVRSENGEVAWAGSLSRRAATSAFSEESVHRLGHQVIVEIITRMISELAESRTADARSAK